MGYLEETLQGKSLADYTNTQLRIALGAALYTNTADMWGAYLRQQGYTGSVCDMMARWFVATGVPAQFRNYINAGLYVAQQWIPSSLFEASDVGAWYDLDDDMDAKIAYRRNHLLWSEDFSNAVWMTYNSTKVGATVIDGVSCMEISMLANASASLEQTLKAIGVIQTATYRVRAKDTSIKLRVQFGNTDQLPLTDIPLTWVDLVGVANGSANTDTVSVRNGENIAKSFYIATAQVNLGPTATPYQKVTDWNTEFLAQFPNHALFQDSAGATAVTAVEQPLGMVKDKSGKGNHRTQATTGSKPKWSARKNLMYFGSGFSNPSWIARGAVTNTTGQLDPLGGNNATLIANLGAKGVNDFYASNVSNALGSSTAQELSFYIDKLSSTGTITVENANGVASGLYSIDLSLVGSGYQRITSQHAAVTVTNVWKYSSGWGPQFSKSSGSASFYLYGVQVENGTVPTSHQESLTATDYDAAGFPKFATYDGVNDSMATASIDFTATDKMTVAAGVTKLSDSGTSVMIELSASADVNNGAFYIGAPVPAGASNYAAVLRGSTTTNGYALTTFAAPITNILAVCFDISGNTTATELPTTRVNGAVPTRATVGGGSDSGTGNFGNYPLYFGARAGTSFYFNGQENQTLVINRPLTAGELANIETFNATKTGVTI